MFTTRFLGNEAAIVKPYRFLFVKIVKYLIIIAQLIHEEFYSILNDFELSEESLMKIVTDNASNMIRAFQTNVEDENEQYDDLEEYEQNFGLEEESDEFADFERNELVFSTKYIVNKKNF